MWDETRIVHLPRYVMTNSKLKLTRREVVTGSIGSMLCGAALSSASALAVPAAPPEYFDAAKDKAEEFRRKYDVLWPIGCYRTETRA